MFSTPNVLNFCLCIAAIFMDFVKLPAKLHVFTLYSKSFWDIFWSLFSLYTRCIKKIVSKSCFPICFPITILILWETLFTCLTWIDMMPSLSKNHGVFKIIVFSHCFPETKNQQLEFLLSCWFSVWTSQGLNLGPPDYEYEKVNFCDSLRYVTILILILLYFCNFQKNSQSTPNWNS